MNNESGARLIANRWQCEDGTILHSKHRHDLVGHTLENGDYVAVDGGTHYIRLVNPNKLKDRCVYTDSSHEDKREVVEWGSWGKNGDMELHHILLKDMTTEHIKAILRTQKHIEEWLFSTFCNELQYRKEHNLEG